ncbi:MAG: phosphate ABC transporter, permease protein PstA, partial [Chlorobium sp.]
MNIGTRKILDRSFTAVGIGSIVVMALALMIIVVPIVSNGIGAILFTGTIEHRKMLRNEFQRGNVQNLASEVASSERYRARLYEMLTTFEGELETMAPEKKREYMSQYSQVKTALQALLGPLPGDTTPMLTRFKYGQTRWEKAEEKLHELLYESKWDNSNADIMGKEYFVSRAKAFEGTALAPIFPYIKTNLREMLLPEFTLYWGFITDSSVDSHFFGGIWPEIKGTFFLAIGAMLFAFPLGVVAAIYFTEYAKPGFLNSML